MEAFLGGLAGALIGAVVTIYVARIDRESEARQRYNPERFALYREYLDMCRDRVEAVKEQVRIGHQFQLGRIGQPDIPTLGTTAALEAKFEQVVDVFPSDTLSPLVAHTLLNSVRMLDIYAYRAGHVATDPASDEWKAAIAWYEQVRDIARNAYLTETGAAPGTRKPNALQRALSRVKGG